MKRILFILLFIPTIVFSQTIKQDSLIKTDIDTLDNVHKKDTLYKEISFNVSIRNPKSDTCKFDYLLSQSLLLEYKKIIFSYKLTYERQGDVNYFSHQEKLEYKFFQFQNLVDADRHINFKSATIYYQKKWFKLGVSDLYEADSNRFMIYSAVKYKFIASEIYFFDNVNKFILTITPNIKTYKNISLGMKGNYIYSNKLSTYHILFNIIIKC